LRLDIDDDGGIATLTSVVDTIAICCGGVGDGSGGVGEGIGSVGGDIGTVNGMARNDVVAAAGVDERTTGALSDNVCE
jgi:hypothetical protein